MLGCLGEGYDVLALVKPQFEVGRGRVGKGGVVRDAEDRRAALVAAGEAALALGAAVLGYHSSGLPGPKGNRETFLWLTDPAPRRTGRDPRALVRAGRCRRRGARAARAAGARGRAVREITVFTHRRPEDTTAVLVRLAEQAADAGVTLRLDEEETRKHGLQDGPGDRGERAGQG